MKNKSLTLKHPTQAALRGLSIFGDETIVRNVLSRMESSDFKVRDLALKALLLVSERKCEFARASACEYLCGVGMLVVMSLSDSESEASLQPATKLR